MAEEEGRAEGDEAPSDRESQERNPGRNLKPKIPERVVRKLARIARLEYKPFTEGGGLCLGIEVARQRSLAMMLLSHVMIADLRMADALKRVGAGWMDVAIWREDPEYAQLWAAAVMVRRDALAADVEDRLWSRSLDGYEVEDVKRGEGGALERVTVKKFDNNLGVNLLKGIGHMGGSKRVAVRVEKPKRDSGSGKPVGETVGVDALPDEVANPPDSVDTVLFCDRKTAFAAMGKAGEADGAEKKEG